MKRFGTKALTLVIASSLIVMPASAAPSVDDIKKSKEAAQGEVNSLQAQLTSIIEKIDDLELELISTGEEIDKVTVDLEETKELEKQQYEDMKLRIKYMYEQGDATAFEAIITAKDFSDLVNKAEYVQNVHSYDRKKLNEYVETKKKVAKLKTKLETEQKNLETKAQQFQSKEDELNTVLEEKRGEVADLDEQLQAAVEEAARRAAEEEKARQEAAKEAAQQAAAQQKEEQKQQSQNNNTNSGNNTDDSDSKNEDKDNNNSNSDKNEDKDDSSDEPGYSAPVGGSVVDRAYSKLGCPYKYGAVGPNSFDCSGFVSFCLTGQYKRIGTSGTFAGWPRVSNPQPGDICVKPGHVGIYIGNGKMIHAPHTGDVVKISNVHSGMWYVRR